MSLKITPVTLGNARFTVYSPGCVRMEYAKDGQFSNYPSLLVGSRTARSVKADVTGRGKNLRIKTDAFELRYVDNGENFSAENLQIVHRNHTGQRAIWTPAKKDQGNIGTVTRSLDFWKWCGGPERFPVEGILSTEGGHFLPDEPRVYWNTRHAWPEDLSSRVWFDGYFFAYGNNYKSALQDFVKVFGRIPMVPRWTFGFWYSRWYAYTDKQFIELAKRYRREGVPIDVMIIDTDWRDGWGGYDWSRNYFPAPEKALKALKKLGLRTSLNDHPGYDRYDPLPESDRHLPALAQRLGPLPHQGQWACDWSNKNAVRAWKDVLLGPFFKQGMDFWWIDGWIKPPFGKLDSQLWANRQYYEVAEEQTGKRGLILSRWGGIGSHRYPVQFSGDTPSDWSVLRKQIEFTAASGTLGAIYWSHDIGGFFERGKVDEELFIRWFQFGAMSPVFRTHSDHGIREPWKYGVRVRRLFRKQTRIRYALAPYLYTLSREAHDTGLPIVRPLYLEYNDNDGGALYRRQQYTIGRDLLVIPADHPADKRTGFCRKRVYFPNGTWYGLETNEVIFGMDDRFIDIPLERIPTYVRGGAILPCQAVGEALGTKPPAEMHFDYYPDPLCASVHTLYEDDGESMEYQQGRCARTVITASRSEEQLTWRIDAPKGSYTGMPKRRTYVLRCRLEEDEEVSEVQARIGGKKVRALKHRITRQALAGAVRTPWRFCEVRVVSPNRVVRVDIRLRGGRKRGA